MKNTLKKNFSLVSFISFILMISFQNCGRHSPDDPYFVLDKAQNRSILFHPTRYYTSPPDQSKDIFITARDNTRIHCRVYHSDRPDSPAILLFHGNGETVSSYDHPATHFRRAGVSLFVSGYREYGRSEGRIGSGHLIPDAEDISDFFMNFFYKKQGNRKLYIMGRSLGGFPAAVIAAKHQDSYRGLILESAFSDAVPVLESLGADLGDSITLKEKIRETLLIPDYLKNLKIPVLIFHGTEDVLIPFHHAEENFRSLPHNPKSRLVPLEGASHNNTFFHKNYFIKLSEFLKDTAD